jgi:hypothetical protein
MVEVAEKKTGFKKFFARRSIPINELCFTSALHRAVKYLKDVFSQTGQQHVCQSATDKEVGHVRDASFQIA